MVECGSKRLAIETHFGSVRSNAVGSRSISRRQQKSRFWGFVLVVLMSRLLHCRVRFRYVAKER